MCLPLLLQVQERRATRGLAAAARLQGQFRPAIKYLERVLDISREMGEYTGESTPVQHTLLTPCCCISAHSPLLTALLATDGLDWMAMPLPSACFVYHWANVCVSLSNHKAIWRRL